MLRVYLNGFDAPTEQRWSIDRGTKATEQRFANVLFSNAAGKTMTNPAADNVTEPRAWIELMGIDLHVMGNCAIVGKNCAKLSRAIKRDKRPKR